MAKTATLSPANLKRKNQGHQRLSVCNSNHETVIEMGFAIANYYIPYHLRDTCKQDSLRGLPKSYLIPPAQPAEVCSYVAKLCTKLEKESCSFFENLPNQMNLRQDNAKNTFMRICKQVCQDGINWGRIMTVYALAGVFAVHFVNKGQVQLVTKIPSWIKEVVEKHLVDWLVQEGGWVSENSVQFLLLFLYTCKCFGFIFFI